MRWRSPPVTKLPTSGIVSAAGGKAYGGNIPFGQWLRLRRKKMGLTQENLAERVSCTFETIRKIEAGRRRPSRQLAEILADYLGVPADEHRAFVQYARSTSAGQLAQFQ